MRERFLIALGCVLLLCAAGQAKAQFCPPNIDFENGNLNYWRFFTGYNNATSGITFLGSTSAITGRQTLTSGTATDYYGGFPVVDPNGGSHSLKLGNDGVGAQVDQARYVFTVPSSVNNYSLIYRYAVVLENPAHNPNEQPYFRVRVYDSATGNIINCASFLYVSNSSLPGFLTSPHSANHSSGAVVYYKPWATASLNLTGQAGKTLVAEFTAADCALGAHMGYGYIDVSCGLFTISTNACAPATPLTAPPGFQTYTWYNANYTQLIDTGRTITVPTPGTATQFHVVLTPYPGYGCEDTLTTTVIGSTLAIQPMRDTTLCNHSSITLSPVVTGNMPPFTYSWTPSAGLSCTACASPSATPAMTTSYVLSVTDSFGCVRRDTVTVAAKPSVSATGINATCANLANGSATAVAAAGAAPYAYSWNTTPPQSGASATGLSAGTYTVTATDAHGCVATDTVMIAAPASVIASIASKTDVSCYGGNDGAATALATGGASPYTFSWNTSPAQTTTAASGLSAGTAIVTVTDAHGCADTESVNILQPAALAMSVNLAAVLCSSSTGAATVTASGGTPPYSYAADAQPFGSSNTLSGLNAGSHTLHLKDAHGCTLDTIIAVAQPGNLSLSITVTQPLCFGDANGSVTIAATGGALPVQYAIGTGSFAGTGTFSGLGAGTYILHAKDANGCIADTSITLVQPAPVAVVPVVSDPLCFGSPTGAISVSASGGSGAYTYALDGGSYGATAAFTGIAAGTHTVHVKDAMGCVKDSALNITQPAALSLNAVVSQPLCNGATNGSITISGSGGTAPYEYALNGGAFGMSNAFSGLAAGTYALHLKDANGCTKDSVVTLGQPAALTAAISKTNVSCYGGANGTAQVSVSGGTAPYSYAWTGTSQTTAAITGLAAGTYSVTVTDAKGCNVPASISITQPTAIAATASATAPTCNNTATGSGMVSVSGGTPPYSYSWNTAPVRNTATASGLNSGSYTVSISDAAGCTATATVIVPATPAIVVSIIPADVTCNGGRDGAATATITNGHSPFSYAWNTPSHQSGATATGLSAGNYSLTVTDAKGCTSTGSATVQEPSPIKVKLSIHNTCPGTALGSLSAVVSGGNAGYSYLWNTTPQQTTTSISGLQPGNYSLLVTDTKGCTDSALGVIDVLAAPQVNAGPDQELCAGQNTLLAASGAQSYQWSPAWGLSCTDCQAPAASPASDTSYTLIGTDANGCKDTDQVRISVMQHVPVSVGKKQVICAGDSAMLEAAGGIALEWLPPVMQDRSSASPMVWPEGTTTYQVVITENQCFTDTLSQTIEVLPAPTVDLGPDLDAPNGTLIHLHATVNNATAILWTPQTGLSCNDCFSPDFIMNGKATFIARVTNALGCAATDTISIGNLCDEHAFFFPNVFTPNGDGANDRFYPQGAGSFPVQHFMIYDRWGEVVFSAANISVNDPNAGWDGTFRGRQLKPDVYVYVMDGRCEDGSKVVLRGDVTLIR